MKPWQLWKQSFTTWETTTARFLDKVMANPAVLNPAAGLLSAVTKAKAASNRAASQWWSMVGLPTRVDQERSLHKLNQLESRLLDLEEQLALAAPAAVATAVPRSAPASPSNAPAAPALTTSTSANANAPVTATLKKVD